MGVRDRPHPRIAVAPRPGGRVTPPGAAGDGGVYGPSYAGFEYAGLDGGLDGAATATTTPLVILRADALEDALTRVTTPGRTVVRGV